MADVTLTYKGSTILSLEDSATKTIKTGGKFCEGDIGVSYVKPSGSGTPANYFADEAMPDSVDGNNGDLYIKGGTFYTKGTNGWTLTPGETAIDSTKSYSYAERTGPNIFGVEWTLNDSSAFIRLTPENDPEGLVTIKIDSVPEPATGNSTGYSPFDDYLPWSGMEEYNIVNGTVAAKYGDEGFSRTMNDTVVFIPEFWIKAEQNNNTYRLYLSDSAVSGFIKHPGSGKYISKYFSVNSYMSTSGNAPLAKMTFAAATTGTLGKGSGWSMLDIEVMSAVQMLYIVEFADWDCQAKIGNGYVTSSNTTFHNTGGTDSMQYHTGLASGTDGSVQVQYRHIEDLWGNLYSWIDRIEGVADCYLYAGTTVVNANKHRYLKNNFTFAIKETGANTYTQANNSPIESYKVVYVLASNYGKTDSTYYPAVPNPSGYIYNVIYHANFPWAIIPSLKAADYTEVGAANKNLCAYATCARAVTSKVTTPSLYDHASSSPYHYRNTGGYKVAIGGSFKDGPKASMFCYYSNNTGEAVANIGCRMQFDPNA